MDKTLGDLTHLIGLEDQDFQTLKRHAGVAEAWADDLMKAFYDTLYAYPPTAEVFREGERPAREETLLAWYREVVGGSGGRSFWVRQWIVGLVHIKRHVSNAFMISMASRIQILFLERCLEAFDPGEALALFGAFKRVTDVVVGLIAEGYHQGYRSAVEEVSGMKGKLLDRMADVAVDDLLAKAREELG